MSRREGARPWRAATAITAGIITITTGVLLMKGDTSRQAAISASSRRRSPAPAAAASHSPSWSTQPVRDSAALMMNRQAMVIGALLPNTPSTSLVFSMPATSSTPTATMTATSGFTHSRTKATKRTTRTRPTKRGAWSSGSGMAARMGGGMELSCRVYAFKRLDIP